MTVLVWLVACGSGGGGASSDGTTPAIVEPGGGTTQSVISPGEVAGPGEPAAAMASGDCNATADGGPLADAMLTGELKCGEVTKGHTRGGVQMFDTKFYERSYCTPATTQHDSGDERVYKLVMPEPQSRAIIWLDSPCGNLDLAAFRTKDAITPTPDTTAMQCEMNVKPGTKREMVDLRDNDPTTWWVVVEGQGDAEGAFALTVSCEKWGDPTASQAK